MLSASLLFVLPLVFGLLCFFLKSRPAYYVSLIGSVSSLFYFIFLLINYTATQGTLFGWEFEWIAKMHINLHLALDGMTILPLFLSNLIGMISIFSAFAYQDKRNGSYFGLLLMSIACLNAFFMAQNPFTFYLFFELALIPIYFLVIQWGGPQAKKSVFTFFIYTVFGSFLLLAALIYFYSYIGINVANNWSDVYLNKIPEHLQYWFLIAFFIAFGIKSPVFPFHSWQANLYEQADKPTVILIAAVMSKMGIFGFLRFNLIVQQALQHWGTELIVLCLIGVIYGALIAWRQNHFSRLLAFSSLSHMGLIAAGTLTVNAIAMEGALFQCLAHGIAVAGLFLVADVVARKTGNEALDGSSGMAKVNPRLATYYFILVLASVGLPLTSGFVGELLLISALTKYQLGLGIIAGVSIILGAVYMLQCYQRMMFGAGVQDISKADLSLFEDYGFIILIILVFALGFFPIQWFQLAFYGVTQFGDYFMSH
ncbi:MAG TPA: NADH-quinone oxidoreductase subunit M [Saprospiraceae bacterium]|nr:NADH-quinone oxidoreductase subunit M [Saprospiraceae bacterium]